MASTTDQVAEVATGASTSPDAAAEAGAPAASELSVRRALAIIALAVATVVVVGFAVKFGMDLRADNAADERDRVVGDTAERIAVQLVSLDHDSADDNLKAIAADSTGSFRDQWDKISGNFASVLRDGQVRSTGEVKESGIVAADDAHATVLTAVTSTVKNTEAPEGQQRVYRMKMTMDHTDGRWLVSNVEFVA